VHPVIVEADRHRTNRRIRARPFRFAHDLPLPGLATRAALLPRNHNYRLPAARSEATVSLRSPLVEHGHARAPAGFPHWRKKKPIPTGAKNGGHRSRITRRGSCWPRSRPRST
jgi:hypothetical protein